VMEGLLVIVLGFLLIAHGLVHLRGFVNDPGVPSGRSLVSGLFAAGPDAEDLD
jgi:hypothetical protein